MGSISDYEVMKDAPLNLEGITSFQVDGKSYIKYSLELYETSNIYYNCLIEYKSICLSTIAFHCPVRFRCCGLFG